MFAIVSDKGKQYKFEIGKTYRVDLSETGEKKMKFAEVLLVSDDKDVKVGTPTIKDAFVEAEVVNDLIKDEKVQILKFHAKKRYLRRNGHRQKYTEVKILSINA